MANMAQLIRRQSSRELLRVPLDRLEMREMQHRLLPGPGESSSTSGPYGGTANAAFVDETVTTQQPPPLPPQQQVNLKFSTFSFHARMKFQRHSAYCEGFLDNRSFCISFYNGTG